MSGSLCPVAVVIHSLAFLISWFYKEITSIHNALIDYGDSAYTHLWYAYIIIGMQDYFLGYV